MKEKLESFEREGLELLFDAGNGGLRGISKDGRGFRFSSSSLWRIRLKPAAVQPFAPDLELTNKSEGRFTLRKLENGVDLHWRFKALEVDVSMEVKDGLSHWRLNAGNRSDAIIWEVEFPCLEGLGRVGKRQEDDYLALPWQWGVYVADPLGFLREGRRTETWAGDLEGSYPGLLSMQFLAYGSPGVKSLYFAAYDGEARRKRLGLYGSRGCRELSCVLKNYQDDMLAPGLDYEMPYDAVIGVCGGAWWESCLLYRKWAVRQKWLRKGAAGVRKDIPPWVKDTGLWIWNYNDFKMRSRAEPEDIAPALADLRRRFKVPLAFHWYGWDSKPHDSDYPDFKLGGRAMARFKRGLKLFHKAGAKVLPYMNGRLWNASIESWSAKGAASCACLKFGDSGVDGSHRRYYVEPYGDQPFVTMCPGSRKWREILTDRIVDILKLGPAGVYVDQVSSAFSVACFARNHGHKPGGGNFWLRGYAKMMECLRGKVLAEGVEDAAFSSESVVECFIDSFDAFLGYQCAWFNDYWGQASLPLPLFTSVYHPYMPVYATGSSISDGARFHLGLAWDIAGGLMPSLDGYYAKDLGSPEYEGRLRFLGDWVAKYAQVKEELLDAEWLPPEGCKPEVIEVKFPGGAFGKEVPALVVSLWRTKNGRLILIAVNHTEEERRLLYNFSSIAPAGGARARFLEILQRGRRLSVEGDRGLKLERILKAHSVNMYQVEFPAESC